VYNTQFKIRHSAAASRWIVKRPDLVAHVVVDGQRKHIRLVTLEAQQITDPPGAVADGVTSVCRWNPLVDDHGCGARAAPTN
jgi:hypothetical protein